MTINADGARAVRGVYYFETYPLARAYAQRVGAPTDRIIAYELGWAIQLHKSGPYVGPYDWYGAAQECPFKPVSARPQTDPNQE